MSDLQDRLDRAAGPSVPFPVEAVGARVRRRRQVRAAASGLAVVAVAVSVGMAVLPRQPAVDLEVGSGPAARPVEIDPVDAPTRLPDGYDRCGRVTHDGDVTVQRFCNGEGAELVLRFGPHEQLPELGTRVDQVRGRPVHVEMRQGRRLVTISDRQAPDDRHYRAEAPQGMATDALVDVVLSVPAFVATTDPQ